MKSLAALAAAGAVLAGGALTSTAASHSGAAPVTSHVRASLIGVRWLGQTGWHETRSVAASVAAGADQPADTTTTPTDTATPAATATASATAQPTPTATTTPSNLPDASSLLSAMASALQVAKTVHFQESSIDHQPGGVDLSVKDTGDATCTGFAVKAHVTASAVLQGTSQSEKDTYDLIRIKKKDYWKDKSHTKGVWQTTKDSANFPFMAVVMSAADNPLACFSQFIPAAATGGTGSGASCSDQPSGLTNAGEMTFNGVTVYDIHYVDVQLCTNTTQPTDTPVDLYVGKDHPLLYGTLVNFDYRSTGADYGQALQKFSKYGEKFSQKAPKVGSKTP